MKKERKKKKRKKERKPVRQNIPNQRRHKPQRAKQHELSAGKAATLQCGWLQTSSSQKWWE